MNLNNENKNERELNQVIDTLPQPIKEVVELMNTKEEKLMALFASTAMSGALMPKVSFYYDGVKNHPNTYVLIIFPPASGKGRLGQLSKLFDRISDYQLSANSEKLTKYRADLKKYEKAISKGETATIPSKPVLRSLLIPGNTTSARLISQLAENDGVASLIFETEADTLSHMLNSTFGSTNSIVLRNAWHNERIALMRKLNDENIVVRRPNISLVVTGTESQVPSLIKGTEDGLFSRFLILRGGASDIWKDVSPAVSKNLISQEISKMKSKWYDMFNKGLDMKLEVNFTEEQWEEINSFGKQNLSFTKLQVGAYATSIPKRHSLMIARIAAMFTAARCLGQDESFVNPVVCNGADFQNALFIVKSSFDDSIDLFNWLQDRRSNSDEIDQEILEMLPDAFKRADVGSIEKKFSISRRSMDRKLKKWIDGGNLRSTVKGSYKKTSVADVTDDAQD